MPSGKFSQCYFVGKLSRRSPSLVPDGSLRLGVWYHLARGGTLRPLSACRGARRLVLARGGACRVKGAARNATFGVSRLGWPSLAPTTQGRTWQSTALARGSRLSGSSRCPGSFLDHGRVLVRRSRAPSPRISEGWAVRALLLPSAWVLCTLWDVVPPLLARGTWRRGHRSLFHCLALGLALPAGVVPDGAFTPPSWVWSRSQDYLRSVVLARQPC